MEDRRPVWVWTSGRQLAPHQLRVYPVSGLFVAGSVGVLVLLGAFSILGALPPFALPAHPLKIALASLKLGAWAFSVGHLFPTQAPINLHLMSGWATIIKALASLALASAAALKVWFMATLPRDGYEHIRGTKVYHGEAASRVLARELRQGKK
jgi:hypothetical protein